MFYWFVFITSTNKILHSYCIRSSESAPAVKSVHKHPPPLLLHLSFWARSSEERGGEFFSRFSFLSLNYRGSCTERPHTCVVYSVVEPPAVFQLWAYFDVSVRTVLRSWDRWRSSPPPPPPPHTLIFQPCFQQKRLLICVLVFFEEWVSKNKSLTSVHWRVHAAF